MLKDIGDALGGILRTVHGIVEAFGGWGVALKGLAYGGMLSIGGGLARRGGERARRAFDLYESARDVAPVVKRRIRRRRKAARSGFDRLRKSGGSVLRSTKARAVGLGRGAAAAASFAGDLAATRAAQLGGGLKRLAKPLASPATRFVPLAMGALKALGAALAGLSLPVTLAVAAVAAGAFLIWKHWDRVKAAFSSAWEWISSIGERFSSIDWSDLGKRLLTTLADGIRMSVFAPWNALRSALGRLRDLLPGSDARTGPLSRLTASGAAIVSTLGEGVRSAGAGALQRPLSRALGTAAAGLALTVPATVTASAVSPPRPALEERLRAVTASAAPASAQPSVTPARTVHHHHYRIEIRQAPGEDAQDLARRVLDEIERRRREEELGRNYDGG